MACVHPASSLSDVAVGFCLHCLRKFSISSLFMIYFPNYRTDWSYQWLLHDDHVYYR